MPDLNTTDPIADDDRKLRRRNASILLSLFLFPVLFLAALYVFQRESLKRAAADSAIYAAETSPALAAQIGLPIEPGWPVKGQVIARDGFGNADLEIPISGSRGKGKLMAWLQQEHRRWHPCSVYFRAEDGTSLTLVDGAHTHCEPE
jgi:hypothetical protein